MTCCNLLVSLIGQEQALSLSLSSQLLREVQPGKKMKMGDGQIVTGWRVIQIVMDDDVMFY